MAWVKVPGLAGNVYVPDNAGQVPKKHPCKACFSCQWCDENRCQVCRNGSAESSEPLSSNGCTACRAKTPKPSRPEAVKTAKNRF